MIDTPKYLKKTVTETAFIQPILSSNGTLGGNSFAVYCNTSVADYQQNHPAWHAVDNNLNTDSKTVVGAINEVSEQRSILGDKQGKLEKELSE